MTGARPGNFISQEKNGMSFEIRNNVKKENYTQLV